MQMINETQTNRRKVEIHTLLKFTKSQQSDQLVSYVSANPVTGQIKGVRGDSKYPHVIVVCSPSVTPVILPNVLYKVTLVPMNKSRGYVCVSAEPQQFIATVNIEYEPREKYNIIVSFGNKTMLYDPLMGRKSTVLTIQGFIDTLQRRLDIKNIDSVLAEVSLAASALNKRMKKDGVKIRI